MPKSQPNKPNKFPINKLKKKHESGANAKKNNNENDKTENLREHNYSPLSPHWERKGEKENV